MKTYLDIKTLEDACADRGVSSADVTPYPEPVNDFQKAVNTFAHSVIVIEAINGGEVPDYDNPDQDKIEIWWDMRGQSAGGPGFSFLVVRYAYSFSNVGARLVFLDRDRARYFASQFKHLFEGFMVKKKPQAIQ